MSRHENDELTGGRSKVDHSAEKIRIVNAWISSAARGMSESQWPSFGDLQPTDAQIVNAKELMQSDLSLIAQIKKLLERINENLAFLGRTNLRLSSVLHDGPEVPADRVLENVKLLDGLITEAAETARKRIRRDDIETVP